MKKYLVVSLILVVLPAASKAEWTFLGDYVGPYKTEGNIVAFTCTNETVKVEDRTEDI